MSRAIFRDRRESRWQRLRRRGALPALLGLVGIGCLLVSGGTLRYSPALYRRALQADTARSAPSPPGVALWRLLTDHRAEARQRAGEPEGGGPREDSELHFLRGESRAEPAEKPAERPAAQPPERGGGETAGQSTGMPRSRHPWGTDAVGRDLLLGSLLAGTIYWGPGLAAACLALGIGTLLGGVGAFARRGAVRRVLELSEDALGSLPKFVAIMVVLSVFRITIWTIAIPLGILTAPRVARVVGGKIRALKHLDFVDSARELGLRDAQILWRHLLGANCRGTLLAQGVLVLSDLMLFEAALGYLGFGLEGGARSWGTLMAEGATHRFLSSGLLWPAVFPAAVLLFALLSLDLLARGVERMIATGQQT